MVKTDTLQREALVDTRVTDKFVILRSTVTGRSDWRAKGFTILLLVEGSCRIATPREEVQLRQFDRIVVPHGQGPLTITAPDRAVLIECLPPASPIE